MFFLGPMLLQELPPFNPVTIVLDIIGAILRLLGISKVDFSAITRAINSVWQNFVIGIGFVYNYIRSLVIFLKAVLLTIVKGLEHIIKDVLHGHLLDALHDIQKLFHDLQTLFAPILKFIATLRGWFYKYVYKYIKLVQDILSSIRVILSAFRILGAKWAAQLDADIAKIQGYITGVLQGIVGTLNQASTWLNFALDPLGIIRRDFMHLSVFSSLASVRRAVSFGKDRYLTASEAQNTQDDLSMAHGGAAILTRNADGSVSYSSASQRINANAATAWNSLGPPHVTN